MTFANDLSKNTEAPLYKLVVNGDKAFLAYVDGSLVMPDAVNRASFGGHHVHVPEDVNKRSAEEEPEDERPAKKQKRFAATTAPKQSGNKRGRDSDSESATVASPAKKAKKKASTGTAPKQSGTKRGRDSDDESSSPTKKAMTEKKEPSTVTAPTARPTVSVKTPLVGAAVAAAAPDVTINVPPTPPRAPRAPSTLSTVEEEEEEEEEEVFVDTVQENSPQASDNTGDVATAVEEEEEEDPATFLPFDYETKDISKDPMAKVVMFGLLGMIAMGHGTDIARWWTAMAFHVAAKMAILGAVLLSEAIYPYYGVAGVVFGGLATFGAIPYIWEMVQPFVGGGWLQMFFLPVQWAWNMVAMVGKLLMALFRLQKAILSLPYPFPLINWIRNDGTTVANFVAVVGGAMWLWKMLF